MKRERDTSIVIQETMRCWLPDRSAEGEEKNEGYQTGVRTLNQQLSQSIIFRVRYGAPFGGVTAKITPVFSRAKRIDTG